MKNKCETLSHTLLNHDSLKLAEKKPKSYIFGHTAKFKLLGWKKKPEARTYETNPNFLRSYNNGYKTFEYAGDNPWEKNSIRIRLLLLKNY
jgi:hypothetical protein